VGSLARPDALSIDSLPKLSKKVAPAPGAGVLPAFPSRDGPTLRPCWRERLTHGYHLAHCGLAAFVAPPLESLQVNRTPLSRRLLLGAGFSLSYGFSAVGGFVVAAMLGVRSTPAFAASVLAAGGLGLIAAAIWAPRVVPDVGGCPLRQRVASGLAGIAAAAIVGQLLMFAGLDHDALSRDPSPSAMAEEAIFVVAFYGAMYLASALTLGVDSRRASA